MTPATRKRDKFRSPSGATARLAAPLLAIMAEPRVGLRPGRIAARVLKRRPRNFPLLMQPRALARQDVRLHAHPKKAQ
ncbi:hypothetical protein [uncultured Thiodictyon sp.]|uniref:hypothetical protein n=1 Tax=uncultured Thiodictyon sp. TaxID=1846217 RepID=UPI0025E60423|nr:hypothetical protein [uncultured Thiodictyon sp.]